MGQAKERQVNATHLSKRPLAGYRCINTISFSLIFLGKETEAQTHMEQLGPLSFFMSMLFV